MPPVTVASFYSFTPLRDLPALRERLQSLAAEGELRGTLILAGEGFNGTLAGGRTEIDRLVEVLTSLSGSDRLALQLAEGARMPFRRLKVRVKREIVTLGQPGTDPRRRRGTAVKPDDWDEVLADPDTVVLDVRNSFEVALGSFTGATDPGTRSFTDFPAFVRATLDPARHRRVAMFCTGGIRCEKASSYMLGQGFAEVLQLEGGILGYLDRIPAERSSWRGACFVFDDRERLGIGLVPEDQAPERAEGSRHQGTSGAT